MTAVDYLVTGATGWIGRHLVDRLQRRPGARIWLMLRSSTAAREAERIARWRAVGPVEVLAADLAQPGLGLDPEQAAPSRFAHVFHLAGAFELVPSGDLMQRVNVEGTQALVEWLLADGFRGIFHHTSSIAASGDFAGTMPEDALDVGQGLHHPYHRSKYEAERWLRARDDLRWRIYRPSQVIGDSRNGEMNRSDGAYFLFGLARRMSRLPRWLPLLNVRPGAVNMVPVDFVVDAMDAIGHAPGWDGRCFHVVDSDPPSMRRAYNHLAELAGSPRMRCTIDPTPPRWLAWLLRPLFALRDVLLGMLGVPVAAWRASNLRLRFETKNLDAALEGSGVACPRQADYLPTMWDYWRAHLDPDRDRS